MRKPGTSERGVALAAAAIAMGLAVGVLAGIGSYTFIYAKGASYMTNDPAACANCHIMDGHYRAWMKGSHRHVAVCNDCHTPHNFFGKYLTKSINGYHHSLAFTTGNFHEPIQITPRNERVTEGACRSCHQSIVEAIEFGTHYQDEGTMSCIRCHDDVGHAE
jgi:cytochrome c nitrite reductase small subunit